MNLTMTIILWVSIIWILPLMWYTLNNETKFKKNIVIGVTLPFEAREDPQVTARLAQFRRELKWVCLGLLAAAVPCWFVRNATVALTLWCTWVDLCIVLPYIPYVRCNRALLRLKSDRGWRPAAPQTLRIDTAAIGEARPVSALWFVPAVALCLLPLVWERSFWPVQLCFALCAALCWVGYRFAYRNRSETVDANVDLTRALTRVRRRAWGRMWLLCAWSCAVFSAAMLLTRSHPGWGVALTIGLAFVLCCAAIGVELKLRRVQESLTKDSGRDWYADEDDHWIGGILYYNPNDHRAIVNNRVGANTTVNLAKRSGRIFLGLTVLLLIALPFTGVLLGGIGSRPMELTLTDTALVCSRGNKEFTVEYEEIADIQCLDELPEGLSRAFGTGAPNLLQGDFYARDIKNLKVCLDPTCPPFLLITTDHGSYLFGTRDPAAVPAIFDQLPPRLPQLTAA